MNPDSTGETQEGHTGASMDREGKLRPTIRLQRDGWFEAVYSWDLCTLVTFPKMSPRCEWYLVTFGASHS